MPQPMPTAISTPITAPATAVTADCAAENVASRKTLVSKLSLSTARKAIAASA